MTRISDLFFILVKVLILVRLIVIVILSELKIFLIKNSDFQQLAGKKH
ncbi:hypothetical protein MNU24_00330 [Spiroplasma poulsonii]|nr:hypothetical protein [Spiroplasma poulsonii]UNF61952.1 hypothetical protein MNU24_00330 [Spiroplasma poulsonii]